MPPIGLQYGMNISQSEGGLDNLKIDEDLRVMSGPRGFANPKLCDISVLYIWI